MAKNSPNQQHPLRTLIVFGLVVAAMFVIMAVNNLWTPKLGLDLRGGTTITLTAENVTGQGNVDAESLELARTIIQQRVDSMGVGETEVSTVGGNQIQVAVPNVAPDKLVDMVGQTAQLNFRIVYGIEQVAADPITGAPTGQGRPAPNLPTPVPTPRPSAQTERLPLDKVLAWKPSVRDEADFAAYKCGEAFPDVNSQALITCNREGTVKYLLGPVAISGQDLKSASAGVPQNQVSWIVQLAFNDKGADEFGKVTSYLAQQAATGNNMFGIVLDSDVISSPTVSEAILGGKAEISGSFTQESATELANVLKYGALPLSFTLSETQNVSPTLGGEQLQAGIIAGIIGLALVLAYSLFYYRGLSIVVVISLALAAGITYAMMVLLGEAMGFALNLPGIAGAIMAIGVTADSFIIYFERIRDDVRDGRSLSSAIETGWLGSRKTILVADAVSLLSAVVLFILAIGSVKGFAFTLGLTTLIDIAIVFFFTKPFVSLLGRTKYFGEGRKFSGFEPEHMGVQRKRRLRRRPASATTTAKEA